MQHIARLPISATLSKVEPFDVAAFAATLRAPLDLNSAQPFTIWRGIANVTPQVEYPNATLADFVSIMTRPAPVCRSKQFAAPYVTLGRLQLAALSIPAKRQWANRGFPGLAIGHARSDAHFEDCGAGILLDYDRNNPDILQDGPGALARLGVFGLCWPSFSNGMISKETGEQKRGGRLFLAFDRIVHPDELLRVALICDRLTGGRAGFEAMKPSQPQGAPVRRAAEVTCDVHVSAYQQVLRVDALLKLAAYLGVAKPTRKAVQGKRFDASALITATPPAGMRERIAAGKSIALNMIDGVEDALPPDLYASTSECSMLADAYGSGGMGDPEPFWWLKIVAASFSSDPRGNAHAFGSADPRYTAEETDKKLEYAIRSQSEKGFGWPACATFARYAPHCATCRHRDERKSPLNFAYAATVAAPEASASPADRQAADQLYKVAKATFAQYRSVHHGAAKMLTLLVDADPAITGRVAAKAVYFLVGRMSLRLVFEMLPTIVAAIDRVLGAGAGNALVGKAIRNLHGQDNSHGR